jgi:excisionase family DNA binding protein
VSVTVTLTLDGVAVPVELDDAALATIAASLPELHRSSAPLSRYMTIAEAAAYLRCSRQRVYDLLSQRRLQRYKDGARTLIERDELEAYLDGGARRR